MQRLRVLALMLACVLALTALAAAQATGAAEQQVLQADKDRFAAMIKVDEAALNKLIADDVVYTHSTALVQSKKEFVDTLKAGAIKYLAMAHIAPDVKVRILGNTALVTGGVAVHVIDHGTDKNMKIRFTEVHTNRSGSWQLLAWQSTVIPAP
jgi:ketosteroid isomerase-like protein